jgi:hypothetical protein
MEADGKGNTERGSRDVDGSEKTALWSQFGAALAMLENAARACPDRLWADRSRPPEFWYLVFHTLFWLDLYLTGAVEGFSPPAPFGLEELDPEGVLPERPYSRTTLLDYLEHGRAKCRATLEGLTVETARRPCRFTWGECSFRELLLYNLRHVQHHAGQLQLLLRQADVPPPPWVGQASR